MLDCPEDFALPENGPAADASHGDGAPSRSGMASGVATGRDATMMSTGTIPAVRPDTVRASRGTGGLSLAVADVGWPNTENLFREIDRDSVDVLLLKCQDYLNGWRRGLFPW